MAFDSKCVGADHQDSLEHQSRCQVSAEVNLFSHDYVDTITKCHTPKVNLDVSSVSNAVIVHQGPRSRLTPHWNDWDR